MRQGYSLLKTGSCSAELSFIESHTNKSSSQYKSVEDNASILWCSKYENTGTATAVARSIVESPSSLHLTRLQRITRHEFLAQSLAFEELWGVITSDFLPLLFFPAHFHMFVNKASLSQIVVLRV